MTENLHDPQGARSTRATGLPGLACLVALAALTVVGCSSTADSTAVPAAYVVSGGDWLTLVEKFGMTPDLEDSASR